MSFVFGNYIKVGNFYKTLKKEFKKNADILRRKGSGCFNFYQEMLQINRYYISHNPTFSNIFQLAAFSFKPCVLKFIMLDFCP